MFQPASVDAFELEYDFEHVRAFNYCHCYWTASDSVRLAERDLAAIIITQLGRLRQINNVHGMFGQPTAYACNNLPLKLKYCYLPHFKKNTNEPPVFTQAINPIDRRPGRDLKPASTRVDLCPCTADHLNLDLDLDLDNSRQEPEAISATSGCALRKSGEPKLEVRYCVGLSN